MIEPFVRNYHFSDAEWQNYWDSAVILWDLLSHHNKTVLLLKWKNERDAIGNVYDPIRFTPYVLHKAYGTDIHALSQDVLDEKLRDSENH